MDPDELKLLRDLIDEQIKAISTTKLGDLNYAGLDWMRRAREARGWDVVKPLP